MRTQIIVIIALCATCCSCSPRDILTRRLARDLIAMSPTFRAPQQFQLRTGVIGNSEYLSPQYLALQHHGWISAASVRCPATIPPPCWDVTLTPGGVETIQAFVQPGDADKPVFSIPAARRELIAITGIAKQAGAADVEFTWRWVALNEIGAVLYSSGSQYHATVALRDYDDGWRLVQGAPQTNQSLDEALKNSTPAQ